jgi:hypothetical protein
MRTAWLVVFVNRMAGLQLPHCSIALGVIAHPSHELERYL